MELDTRVNINGAVSGPVGVATDGVAPITLNNTNASTLLVSMDDYAKVTFLCTAGVIAGGGVLAWQVQESNTAGGGGLQVLPGAAYVTATADTESGTSHVINVDAIALSAGYKWLNLIVTETGVQNALVSCSVLRYLGKTSTDGMPT